MDEPDVFVVLFSVWAIPAAMAAFLIPLHYRLTGLKVALGDIAVAFLPGINALVVLFILFREIPRILILKLHVGTKINTLLDSKFERSMEVPINVLKGERNAKS